MSDLYIAITVPDADREDFAAAFADRFGWVDEETSGPREDFARAQVVAFAAGQLRQWRRERAEAAALDSLVIAQDGIA